MKSKLNRRRGFTIAEIIMAVAIMAFLIVTVMKSLQSSRKSIEADMYRADMYKKATTIKGKVEAALLIGKTPAADLSNIVTTNELKDVKDQQYTVAYAFDANASSHKVTINPGALGVALGVTTTAIEWK